MSERKRGRPSHYESGRNLSIRISEDLRNRLQAAALERWDGKGWTLSQEIIHRLVLSFDDAEEEHKKMWMKARGKIA